MPVNGERPQPPGDGSGTRAVLTHAVLVGLTPMVPLPLLDDLLRTAIARRLVRVQAAQTGVALDEEQVRALADVPMMGCVSGCLGAAFLYPVKRLLRKLLYFLEVKRAVDLVSRTCHEAWLLDLALREGSLAAGDVARARAVRTAIEAACDEVTVTPVERAIRETFAASRGLILGAVGLLVRVLRREKPRTAEAVEAAVDSVEEAERQQLQGIVERLQQALASVPREHFAALEAAFCRALGAATAGSDGTAS